MLELPFVFRPRSSEFRHAKTLPGRSPAVGRRPTVSGKFFAVGGRKIYLRGVTYGPLRGEAGAEYGAPEIVARDFAQMRAIGVNLVRLYTVPPRWLLDLACAHELYLMVGLPWEQHVTFLDEPGRVRTIEEKVRASVAACAGHPAIFCFAIGNEIPSSIVRWYGRHRIEQFLHRLYRAVKAEDGQALVTYVNYPTTEYLDLPFLDFVCFNVYLENQERLESYLARLQNLVGDRPLVMGEIGLDSRRNGERAQAVALEWQIRTAFAAGCAGVSVFSWTDEWSRGGQEITDWDFGLTTRDRAPKLALQAVREAFSEVPLRRRQAWPRVSVVVCTRNGERTIEQCLMGLQELDYPDYEVIVVDDGSTDATAAIAGTFDVRLIRTPHAGLSAARNLGIEAADGEIVAFIDDDAYPDPHWLSYLAHVFRGTEVAGVGGPNLPPADAGFMAECVASAPGGPMHVLVSDREAEHIPGCNMAFRKSCLETIGGFDPQFVAAGDDVDLCWRLQERGWKLGFHAAATVWHHRRPHLRAYLRQQKGYGKAEAMLERKWPDRYNAAGHVAWSGRLYGPGLSHLFRRRGRIYQGTWGTALFQSIYSPAPAGLWSMVLMPEWYLVIGSLGLLSALGVEWIPLRYAVGLLIAAVSAAIVHAILAAMPPRRPDPQRAWPIRAALWLTVAGLHLLQPAARLSGRLRHGLSPLRRRAIAGFSFPFPRRFTIWSECWRPPEQWLARLESIVRSRGPVVRRGGEFDSWDLEVRSGTLGAVRIHMAIEEHGSGRQLVRFRCVPRRSLPRLGLIGGFAVLALAAAVDGAWLAGAVLGSSTLLLLLRKLQERSAAMAAIAEGVGALASETPGAAQPIPAREWSAEGSRGRIRTARGHDLWFALRRGLPAGSRLAPRTTAEPAPLAPSLPRNGGDPHAAALLEGAAE